MKKLIKRLEAARGNGTSMISLIIRMRKAPCPKSGTSGLVLTLISTQGPGLESCKDVG